MKVYLTADCLPAATAVAYSGEVRRTWLGYSSNAAVQAVALRFHLPARTLSAATIRDRASIVIRAKIRAIDGNRA